GAVAIEAREEAGDGRMPDARSANRDVGHAECLAEALELSGRQVKTRAPLIFHTVDAGLQSPGVVPVVVWRGSAIVDHREKAGRLRARCRNGFHVEATVAVSAPR